MKRRLALLPLCALAGVAAAQSSRQQLAEQEARIAAREARETALDRQLRARAQRLAKAEMPTAELLAALQRAALHPPLASLAEPGSLADALQKRAILAAVVPALAARTAELHRDVAALTDAQAAARETVRQARLQLAEMVEALRSGSVGPRATADEQRLLAALPAPPLRPQAGGAAVAAAPVYRLPLTGRVLIGTGEAFAGGARAQGLTLEGAAEATVRAPAAGTISYAGPFGGYGRIVILDHGGGWTSLLAGLAATNVSPGARVAAGAPLGRMPPAAARLTLELKHDGRTVDVAAIAAWRGG